MNLSPSKDALVHAYRNLYRATLRAVKYSAPARFQLRDVLRESFRTSQASNFNPRRVQNTIKFLQNAENYSGFEHHIVKNAAYMQWWKRQKLDKKLRHNIRDTNTAAASESRKQMQHQFRATLIMLNESLDICLAA